MYTLTKLYESIPLAGLWTREKDGFHVSANSSPSGNNTLLISDNELGEIDARLPLAIRFHVEDDPLLTKRDIELMFKVWNCGTVVDTQYSGPVVFTHVEEVYVGSEDVYIDGDGIRLSIRTDPNTGTSVAMPGRSTAQVSMFKMWMNEEYPDWHKRYIIAESLGLNPDEIVRTLVRKEASYETQLLPPDLST